MNACTPFHSTTELSLKKNIKEVDRVQTMTSLKKSIRKLEYRIKEKGSIHEVLVIVELVQNTLLHLRELKYPREESELHQQYCEASLGVLSSMNASLKHSDWSSVQNSMSQLKKLHEYMLNDFGPSGWKRFKFWFRYSM